MSKHTKDKDDRMTITVEKGEETISFQTNPDLHISEFRELLMRLAAAVGYHQSNIEEYFLPKEEQDTQFANEATFQNFQSELAALHGNGSEKAPVKIGSVDHMNRPNPHQDTFV